jgi:hypothetical protein
MLTNQLFSELIRSASLAPSADNMQPWEFRKNGNTVEVFSAPQRMLPTDVSGMFTWMSIGAAIQNIVVASASYGYKADVEYASNQTPGRPVAVIKLSSGKADGRLAEWIPRRATNRNDYEARPLKVSVISGLTRSIDGLNAGIHWMTDPGGLKIMASMDANSSFIRLEHKPLHDELFEILRFSRKQVEETRYGLDYESLGIPAIAVFIARQLQHWSVNKLVSKSGAGRLVAKMLSMKLLKAGALCLVTAKRRDATGYMEAGRAMEQFWLAATAEGLSVHPYGALPQYLTKARVEPETFLPEHLKIIQNHHDPFYTLFPHAELEYPAIVLRVGIADKPSKRSDVRIRVEGLIKSPSSTHQTQNKSVYYNNLTTA